MELVAVQKTFKAGVALEIFSDYFGPQIDDKIYTFEFKDVHPQTFQLYLDHLNQLPIEPSFFQKIDLLALTTKVEDKSLYTVNHLPVI